MMRESDEGGALEAAIQRLDRALAQLDIRVTTLQAEADAAGGGLFDQDRAKLASELDKARGRERDLESAGVQASQALGRAIADIRAALGEDDEPEDEVLDAEPEPDHASQEA